MRGLNRVEREEDASLSPQDGFQSLDWLVGSHGTTDSDTQNFDWLFSEASLQGLYSMAYFDAIDPWPEFVER
jgi:hypothetical protein